MMHFVDNYNKKLLDHIIIVLARKYNFSSEIAMKFINCNPQNVLNQKRTPSKSEIISVDDTDEENE